MTTISHAAAFKAQSDFAPEAKLKIGNDGHPRLQAHGSTLKC